jgi:hypothetical protein
MNLGPCAGALGKFETSLGCVSVDSIPVCLQRSLQMYLTSSGKSLSKQTEISLFFVSGIIKYIKSGPKSRKIPFL